MIRFGQLIEDIADIENLEIAFYKAKKGKGDKGDILEYAKNLYENLYKLNKEILSGDVQCGNYKYFKIYDPKERLICAAPFEQRVLHHSIMNVVHPIFERVQIFDSYASRIGKGTYMAIERAKYYNKKYRWYLKLDFRKYFDSIDHEVLKHQLNKLFRDKVLIKIFDEIIDSYIKTENRGVPIGNLTSQYFANHYLSCLDHYVKEELHIKAYVRYMDDIVLWSNDKSVLIFAGKKIKDYAEGFLKLCLKPVCLSKTKHKLPFLGYLLNGNRLLLSKRSMKRFKNKFKTCNDKLMKEFWTQEKFRAHMMPLVAFTEHADAREFRKSIIDMGND